MENASKALIIAGAILLSILLIGLGMFVYQQAEGAMGKVNMDPQKVAAYNSEFLRYEGTQTGSQTKALLNTIRSHNNANVDDDSLCIVVTAPGPSSPITSTDINHTMMEAIKSGKTYTVSFVTDDHSGYITKCEIVEKTGTK